MLSTISALALSLTSQPATYACYDVFACRNSEPCTMEELAAVSTKYSLILAKEKITLSHHDGDFVPVSNSTSETYRLIFPNSPEEYVELNVHRTKYPQLDQKVKLKWTENNVALSLFYFVGEPSDALLICQK